MDNKIICLLNLLWLVPIAGCSIIFDSSDLMTGAKEQDDPISASDTASAQWNRNPNTTGLDATIVTSGAEIVDSATADGGLGTGKGTSGADAASNQGNENPNTTSLDATVVTSGAEIVDSATADDGLGTGKGTSGADAASNQGNENRDTGIVRNDCPEGTQPDDDGFCVDIDECALGIDDCDDINATCTNTGTYYTCRCNEGYEGSGRVCNDINECNSQPCDINATCTNTPGSYSCVCNAGFSGAGESCTVSDYCLVNAPCEHGECINLYNGYTCDCGDTGYTGNRCQTWDPCASVTCLNGGTCVNRTYDAVCNCPIGYRGDRCEDYVCDQPDLCVGYVIETKCVVTESAWENGAVYCAPTCYPNCPSGQLCWSHDDCASNLCDGLENRGSGGCL